MRRLLALALLGATLVLSGSAAFADDAQSTGQPAMGQDVNPTTPYSIDGQSTPFVPNTQAQ